MLEEEVCDEDGFLFMYWIGLWWLMVKMLWEWMKMVIELRILILVS